MPDKAARIQLRRIRRFLGLTCSTKPLICAAGLFCTRRLTTSSLTWRPLRRMFVSWPAPMLLEERSIELSVLFGICGSEFRAWVEGFESRNRQQSGVSVTPSPPGPKTTHLEPPHPDPQTPTPHHQSRNLPRSPTPPHTKPLSLFPLNPKYQSTDPKDPPPVSRLQYLPKPRSTPSSNHIPPNVQKLELVVAHETRAQIPETRVAHLAVGKG